jgi:hypothetical protein
MLSGVSSYFVNMASLRSFDYTKTTGCGGLDQRKRNGDKYLGPVIAPFFFSFINERYLNTKKLYFLYFDNSLPKAVFLPPKTFTSDIHIIHRHHTPTSDTDIRH